MTCTARTYMHMHGLHERVVQVHVHANKATHKGFQLQRTIITTTTMRSRSWCGKKPYSCSKHASKHAEGQRQPSRGSNSIRRLPTMKPICSREADMPDFSAQVAPHTHRPHACAVHASNALDVFLHVLRSLSRQTCTLLGANTTPAWSRLPSMNLQPLPLLL